MGGITSHLLQSYSDMSSVKTAKLLQLVYTISHPNEFYNYHYSSLSDSAS